MITNLNVYLLKNFFIEADVMNFSVRISDKSITMNWGRVLLKYSKY